MGIVNFRIVSKHSARLAAVAVLLIALPGSADDQPPKSQSGDPPGGSVPPAADRDRGSGLLGRDKPFDLLIRGDRSQFGWFDPDGNFVPDTSFNSFPPGGPMSGSTSFVFTNNVSGPTAMGEHRSGRLILGAMVKGVFVPEIGSKVLDLKNDFDLKKPDRIVYNLRETVPAFWTAERKKQFPRGLPDDPEPPQAGVPAGWKLAPLWQFDRDNRDPWHVRVIGEIAEFGHLDDRGEFLPDHGLPIVARSGLKGLVRFDLYSTPRYYTVPQLDRSGKLTTEDVYEFRSGRLIRGVLHASGNFVPELGSKVIEFKDYDFAAEHRRIYNLPGKLIRIK